jgi:predicted short-subunit dehydrogenase-like oxidoreductase (DUF2520 family)
LILDRQTPRLGFIGAGTVAGVLALALSRRGYPVAAVSSRHLSSAEKLASTLEGCLATADGQVVADTADLIFITTPDDAISAVAGQIEWPAGKSVIHCSGADTTQALATARASGAAVGVFHPLQTFAGAEPAIDNLPGTTFALEAEEPLLSLLKEMAAALGGYAIELKAKDKVIYHAAAVIACNYLVTLIKQAADLWQTFGVPPEQSVRALLPLLKGTVRNIEAVGIPGCLTGPIARGDTGTIAKHLAALEKAAPQVLATYRQLGINTIPVALAKGSIDEEQAGRLEAILSHPDKDIGGNL